MALPLIPVLIGIAGIYFAKEGVKQSKIANIIGGIGILIGIITSIIMIFVFMPESEEEYDIVNYYSDGILHYTGNGSVEDKEGIWTWYSKDGIIIKIETYDHNELDGEYKEFYANGNLKSQGIYDDGNKELDDWKCFNLDGSTKVCEKN